jgi:multicomponent Na+:H+ antiporter subunit E
MAQHSSAENVPPVRAALARGALLFAFWLALMPSVKVGDLVIGAFATAAATWASLRLLPPHAGSLRFGSLLSLVPHFLWESVLAGIDVARRALAPSLALRPGFVKCPLGLPPGFARNTFSTITSLLPGSVPAGDDDGVLVYHCLDTAQPVVEQLWEEERLFARALVVGQRHA